MWLELSCDSIYTFDLKMFLPFRSALASILNVIDPDVVVLGGGLSQIPGLPAQVMKLWEPYVFSDRVVTGIVPALHGNASGVRGAAWLWPDR